MYQQAVSSRGEDGEYLVTIAPEEVLGADVLVGVLGLVLWRGLVGLVFPVGVPSHVAVEAEYDETGDGDAGCG